jgi:membrane-associated phospholipid phosphatase
LTTKIILLITASFVCFSRIALQAHFLSDVLAGIGTALFFIPFAVLLTNKFYNKLKVDEEKLTLLSKRLTIIFIVFAVILGLM